MSKQEHDNDDNAASTHSQTVPPSSSGSESGKSTKTETPDKASTRYSAGGANTPPKHGGSGSGSGGNKGKGSKALVVVLVIVLLVMLVGFGFGAKMLMDQKARLASLDQQVASTEPLKQTLSQQQNTIESLKASIEETGQTQQKVLSELSASQQTDAREWMYAEVEYLLRLANQRLQLERDVSGAYTLLKSADNRLTQADNPALTPVRRQIHSELSALDSVPSVDETGLYLSLASEAQQFERLPLAQDTQALSAKVDDGSTYSGGWREQLARLGQQLKDLVTVRHHDEALEALITPEQEGYLRQNVRLMLEQAQLALLKGQPDIYAQSIERAQTLVKQYYQTSDERVRTALSRLDELANETIHPELPDISASLSTLRDIMRKRYEQQGASE
ncbi:uroporphyrinogen-III C-methyltransferase [Larsenimonas suaedae]|uniref:Uroporphyrinogen-III C-methyltransferase n=1 Tax=Larsenimonas suaedae TaxID=1851019 RepID=A0ABU1H008_9GAMM|nr:uroporphyrinogen-III C-methyltransferase [Larsenimonas suaedae]MCM2973538.1 uroporphyrinogen-III C-methyltransferase [Larsenimonas suaedae]MDR5897092.1 uroporphyrinogen-III C-methyltransferase [Larsenimonas suaedae]